ncbi:response regulator transcription factor [Salipiger marinus]|jgi:DNA-binding response OmpR family regulator|uniref:Response regulator receiver domain-containing protein n=1 Tax=Salipiger marinus TaxID=555512 RepID=A0A1G8LMQ7_9RHOB|nr:MULTISPECIES: response regulator [Salipiger]HBM61754.1 two-component system response regulator [Citreicella sp.]MCD1620810.1 response regulator [Salipiger manganoxidans]MEB3418523.1 response regulator [Salipiger manganoxidans]SDI56954.1 Response regulator receiver domain-containing protein [Salipiger marinus]HBS99868.1 two-component system response regulator [Citreicella sp.]
MSKHVLLIEDEPNIIEAISFILSREGLKVETHSDGTTANARLRGARPDLVILDVMLPGKSGYDILRDLRAEAGLADLPVLMLTARGQTRDREMAERAGVSAFMTKPFSNSEMLDTVRALMDGALNGDA